MRTAWLIGLTILLLALPAQAQRGPGPGRQGRADFRHPRGGPDRMPLGLMARRLAEELDLSDTQREQYDEILARYTEQRDAQRGVREGMRELAAQYREARQSGDDARAEEIRAQMREVGGGRRQMVDEFLTEVEPILDEPQIERLNEFRERMQRRGEDARRRMNLGNLVRRLPEELDLNDEQRAQFDELVAERRNQREQLHEQWRELRPLMEELREARADGDMERVAELEAELEQKRPTRPDFQQFFDKLEPILTAEQKTKLAELREGAAERGGRGVRDVRSVLRAAKRLDLNEEQKDRLKTIIREAQAAERKGRMGREARTELAALVKSQIVEMLDADQAAEFERLLERSERPGRHQRRGGEGRGGPPPAGRQHRGGGPGGR